MNKQFPAGRVKFPGGISTLIREGRKVRVGMRGAEGTPSAKATQELVLQCSIFSLISKEEHSWFELDWAHSNWWARQTQELWNSVYFSSWYTNFFWAHGGNESKYYYSCIYLKFVFKVCGCASTFCLCEHHHLSTMFIIRMSGNF